MANFIVWCVWIGAAFACLASALGVVTFRNPFFSALALIGNLAALAVLYLLLGGEFVAAGQVLVYGGAVMVMFLFVIAYLGDKTDQTPWAGGPSWQIVAAVLAAGSILTEVIVAIGLSTGGKLSHQAHISRSFGSPETIGRLFLTDHLVAFEVTSIVLLVAAVGGVVLGSHARTFESMQERHVRLSDETRGHGGVSSTEPPRSGGAGFAGTGAD
jgi:NADH:ubiquinone oxidoreductase subunit 6 (subunit J)